jgi:hypothetical protein
MTSRGPAFDPPYEKDGDVSRGVVCSGRKAQHLCLATRTY